MQQIARASEQAQKRHNREAVQRRHVRRTPRTVVTAHMMMPGVKADVPEVQMPEAAEERQQAQHQAHAETRQINRLPIEGDHRFDPPRFPFESLLEPLPFTPSPRAPFLRTVRVEFSAATSSGA